MPEDPENPLKAHAPSPETMSNVVGERTTDSDRQRRIPARSPPSKSSVRTPNGRTAGALRFGWWQAWQPIFRLVLVAILLLAVAFRLPPFFLFLATLLMVHAISIMGLQVIYGRAGQISMTQSAFVGIGAYTAAVMGRHFDGDLLVELGVAVTLAIIAGLAVAVPALRVSGLRLAILTFAFLELFQWFVINNPDVAGGTRGLPVGLPRMLGYTLSDPKIYFLLVAALAVGATLILLQLSKTALGRAMLAVRESELAALSVGIDVRRVKRIAFVMSAVCGATSGVLFAHLVLAISPPQFDIFASINLLVVTIIGGSHSTFGAWLGAAYFVLVPEVFAELGHANLFPVVSGAVLIIVLLTWPRGLADLALRASRRVTLVGSRRLRRSRG